ncbi:MAG: 50S ribosomal protein L11 methyltransferase [Gammaproteobacteria bacterium]|nr:50S ribosomal protein L11 methyltransferase [Gammaproteobacteria bacterium]
MFELHITTTNAFIDQLSDEIALHQVTAITWQDAADQSIYEPLPGEVIKWDKMILKGCFADYASVLTLIPYLELAKQRNEISHYQCCAIDHQNWIQVGRKGFEARTYGERLCICPSWEKSPYPELVNVLLDPGLAFGTGAHPTTALCLEWLASHISGNEMILDYGCGSGILALAAVKLGATHVVAVDHDEQALTACCDNFAKNKLAQNQLDVFLPDQLPRREVDIVLANIVATTLIAHADLFAQWTKPKGILVLSGLTETDFESVVTVYQQYFIFKNKITKEGWILLEFVKK